MGDAVSIKVNGQERIAKKFKAISLYASNPRKPLTKAGEFLINEYKENFGTEGQTLNKRWKGLAASTRRQKAALGFGNKGILERTGKLRRGFKKKVKRMQVRVFNPVKYFKYHQLGGRKLPQRVIISATENMIQEIVEILSVGLNKILRR